MQLQKVGLLRKALLGSSKSSKFYLHNSSHRSSHSSPPPPLTLVATHFLSFSLFPSPFLSFLFREIVFLACLAPPVYLKQLAIVLLQLSLALTGAQAGHRPRRSTALVTPLRFANDRSQKRLLARTSIASRSEYGIGPGASRVPRGRRQDLLRNHHRSPGCGDP